MTRRYFAHTRPGAPEAEWEPLVDHLTKVGDLAAKFAAPFGGQEWARLVGLWHDLGKFSAAFQAYLREAGSPDTHIAETASRTDHSSAGAQFAAASVDVFGHLLSYAIAGHHSGLLDGRSGGACLEARLRKDVEPWQAAPSWLLQQEAPALPEWLAMALNDRERRGVAVAFFTRMIFSCLVDADFLATEAFMNPGRAEQRATWPDDMLGLMEEALSNHVGRLEKARTVVNQERERVREACLASADAPRGFFSLTVPTGGGKTLSSLAFALRHARKHELRRIIYVVPFTTIIEQNADAFREALRDVLDRGVADPVLEHHSNFDTDKETVPSRLATENWDAPLIVTTSVQFYESLYACRTSRCRKLHNLARSVIVLDEAQCIPVDFLAPCLRALQELVECYGSTVLLCTATQPAIHRRSDFKIGLESVREITPSPERLYMALRRVEVRDLGGLEDVKLAEVLLKEESALCVVNTRAHARTLFEMLGEGEENFHLSALMCPKHRSKVIGTIRARLDQGRTCRVVSTQLIEAGVDLDFRAVFRSLAGIDSIAQAAGRCNRNGRLSTRGVTYLFRSEHHSAERFLAETADCARQVLPLHDDPLSLAAVEHYFRLYYWDQQARWDSKGIVGEFTLDNDRSFPFLFGFSRVAERFRLIEDGGLPVVVPWGDEGRTLVEELRDLHRPQSRELLRRLQRFTVRIPSRVWRDQLGKTLELVRERFAVLMSPRVHYSDRLGLRLDAGTSDVLIA